MQPSPNLQRFTFKPLGEHPPEQAAKTITFLPMHTPKSEADIEATLPAEPTFNEDDVKNAEREGYKKGFLEGIKDGQNQAKNEQAEIDRSIKTMLEGFTGTFAPLLNDYRSVIGHIGETMPKIALAIARKVAGQALSQASEAQIADLVERCCSTMALEPKLTVSVNDTIADRVEERLRALDARLPSATEIVIVRDPALTPGDCRIAWEHGMMEYATEALWQQMELIISGMSANARREALAHLTPPGAASAPDTITSDKE